MAPDEKNRSPWGQVGFILTVAFVFPAGVIVGYGLGWWLDNRLGTAPLLSVMGLALGFAAALQEVLRELKRLNRK